MASPLLERQSVNLYYLGSRTAFAFLLLTVALFKNAFTFERSFTTFLLLSYATLNLLLFLRGEGFLSARWVRYLDYGLALLFLSAAVNFYGVVPFGVVVVLYSVLFWGEVTLLTAAGSVLLLVWSLLGRFPFDDFLVSFVYLTAMGLVATKWNLLRFVKLERESIRSLKALVERLSRENALKSAELQVYEEVRAVVNRLAETRRTEEVPKVLANFLAAEEVEIAPFRGKTALRRDAVTVRAGRVLLTVRPKHRFLLKDKRYRQKVAVLVQLIRPYLESFLAKSR
ncbi:MAG: hypothetical protein GXO08_03150 [Aquificae bacterium]|nr:hypothetical protein [Aquificota bacterium]